MHRDELLFQVTHQTSELWLKLALERRRGGRAADRGGRPARRAAPPRARDPLHPLPRPAARDARAHVAVGVPGDPQGARPRVGVRLARLERAAARLPAPRAGVPRNARREPGSRSPTLYVQGREHEDLYQLAEALDRARRAGPALAHAALPGRRARDRRQGRRDAGHAGRAARAARHEDVVPRALGGPERADRALEGRAPEWRSSRRASRRGDRAAAGAAPGRHGQPARERDARCRAARDYLARDGIESELYRARARPGEPRRADPGRRRAVARVPLPHGHRPRGSGRVGARPLVGRPRRRRGLGTRRARHEGPGGRLGGRLRVARARGLHAVRRPLLPRRSPTRRWARLRSQLARRGASGRGSLRLRGQRGRRRAARARRAARLPVRDRGEDVGAVHAARPRAQRARVDAGDRATTRS